MLTFLKEQYQKSPILFVLAALFLASLCVCAVGGAILLSRFNSVTVTIEQGYTCPPYGYAIPDKDQEYREFAWTPVTESPAYFETPDGTFSIQKNDQGGAYIDTGPDMAMTRTYSDMEGLAYFQFSLIGKTGVYGPVHVAQCVDGSTYIDLTEAVFEPKKE